MILNDSRLPSFVIGNLYKHCLVDLDTDAMESDKKIMVAFLGGNNRHILFLVNNNDVSYLPDQQLEFLTGILSACKLSIADVAIVNINNIGGSECKDLIESLKAGIIILLGINTPELGLPFIIPEFQVQLFKNKRYLFVPRLDVIENDKELKKNLWKSLKNLFSI